MSEAEKTKQSLNDKKNYDVSSRNKIRGLVWLIAPMSITMLLLTLSPAVFFVLASFGIEGDTADLHPLTITFRLLSALGMLMTVIGIPTGLIYLLKSIPESSKPYDERSGKQAASVIPDEIKGWNWGAFVFNWIWGMYYSVWFSLLVFLPFVAIIFAIILGMKGNEMAWRARKWESVEVFLASQRKWRSWALAYLTVNLTVFLFFLIQRLLTN